MKIAVVYNRVSQRVINLFGLPNREKYGLKNIKRITDALKQGGHQVIALEGDKDLIDKLEDYMPRVVKGERPGMVFNLAYGIQGQARYTHVPGMLEMIGLPYVGSGPLAHSLALDKVVSKMIFVQHGVPTPQFAVLDESGFEMPDLKFPLIVKPKNEAVSFGIQIVRSEKQLREAADVIFNEFQQPVLVERFIAGREINVGILGNSPGEALPPAEIVFGKVGPQIYTYEDKMKKSGREIVVECPAKLSDALKVKAQKIAQQAFHVLGCYDCCRVDMRLDSDGHLFVLEVNSLPSLGPSGSYVHGAAAAGLDFPALVNRLVEVAATRYFGTPSPPDLNSAGGDPGAKAFAYLTERRDDLEREVEQWCKVRSFTNDPVGIQNAKIKLAENLTAQKLKPVADLTDDPHCWTWATPAGITGGTLLVTQLDVPFDPQVAMQMFRREPEWLHGEAIASSRASLVMMLFALRAVRHARRLLKTPIGVLAYADEGQDARYSAEIIRKAAGLAKNVLVLRPGLIGDKFVAARRGQRRYRLVAEGSPLRLGKPTKRTEVLRWMFARLEACSNLTSRSDRVAVATIDLQTAHMPMLLPHQVTATLLTSFPDDAAADKLESDIRAILDTKGVRWKLEQISDRPPMKEGRSARRLAKQLAAVAEQWEIPLGHETSVWPSVAGLVPASTGVVCGLGPVAANLYTPDESVQRISLLQRTLLLSQFLCAQAK